MFVGSDRRKSVPAQRVVEEEGPPQQGFSDQFVLQSVENRDYSGAATFIEFVRDELGQPYPKETALWHGYSLFHLGEYSKAIDVYEKLLSEDPSDTILHLYIASCQFYNQDFDQARSSADQGPACDFRTRLLFHIAHQVNDEQSLFQAHAQLVGTMENQLSLAAIHYMRSNFDEAVEIYQRVLQQHPDYLALTVYIAMCQFKLEQFQESNETVDNYLAANSDSAVGLNLKACCYLRLFDADIAESQLLQIHKYASATYSFIQPLMKHNVVIFHNGDDGFTELPKLVGSLTEARFNLTILYMRESNAIEAWNLMQEFRPVDVEERAVRAAVGLAFGQLTNDSGLIEEANSVLSEIGEAPVVQDTVLGRQCLIMNKLLTGEYDDALRVLDTIEPIIGQCDEFNYNKGMAMAMLSRWAEAERFFLMVNGDQFKKEIFYTSWLCRCYIKNKKWDNAWNLYNEVVQTEDAKTLLHIIANDCYLAGAYYYSMCAYDVLSKYEGDVTLREGMIASAIGVFRNILSRSESADKLPEVISKLASDPEAEPTLQVIQNYIETSGEFDTSGI